MSIFHQIQCIIKGDQMNDFLCYLGGFSLLMAFLVTVSMYVDKFLCSERFTLNEKLNTSLFVILVFTFIVFVAIFTNKQFNQNINVDMVKYKLDNFSITGGGLMLSSDANGEISNAFISGSSSQHSF